MMDMTSDGYGIKATSKFTPDVARQLVFAASKAYISVYSIGKGSHDVIATLVEFETGGGLRRVQEELVQMRKMLSTRLTIQVNDETLTGALLFILHQHLYKMTHQPHLSAVDFKNLLIVSNVLQMHRACVWNVAMELASWATTLDKFDYTASLREFQDHWNAHHSSSQSS